MPNVFQESDSGQKKEIDLDSSFESEDSDIEVSAQHKNKTKRKCIFLFNRTLLLENQLLQNHQKVGKNPNQVLQRNQVGQELK